MCEKIRENRYSKLVRRFSNCMCQLRALFHERSTRFGTRRVIQNSFKQIAKSGCSLFSLVLCVQT